MCITLIEQDPQFVLLFQRRPLGFFPFKIIGRRVLHYLLSRASKWHSAEILLTSFLAKPHSQILINKSLDLFTLTDSSGHETLVFPGSGLQPSLVLVSQSSLLSLWHHGKWKPSSSEISLCVFSLKLI